MAFLSRLFGSARTAAEQPAAPTPAPAPASARRRPLPSAGELRRERRALLRFREERLRDLGGIVLEMVRRDEYRQDLIFEQAAELLDIEERLQELEALLAAATSVRRRPRSVRCECGAPVLWGSNFCANCGRAVAETAAPAADAS